MGASGEKHVDAAEFGAKVRRVLTEPAYRQAARRIAVSMARYGGAREAADHIEHLIGGGSRSGVEVLARRAPVQGAGPR